MDTTSRNRHNCQSHSIFQSVRITTHNKTSLLTPGVLQSVYGRVHDAYTPQEPCALFLVHFLVIPNTDCDRVLVADVTTIKTDVLQLCARIQHSMALSVRVHVLYHCKKGKGSFYIVISVVSSPLDGSNRYTLFASPGRHVNSDTNSASLGSILAMQQLRATTKSLTFPPLSIARYSFIQLSQLGRQWRERKFQIFETVAKGDSNPVSLDCESGILLLSYSAPCAMSRFCNH